MKEPGIMPELTPLHPAFDRDHRVSEELRRQFDVTLVAIQIQDVLHYGGLGGRRKLRCDRFGAADELAVMRSRSGIFHDAIRDVVEIPQARQALLIAGEAFEHVLADLLLRAHAFPDADFVHLPVEVGIVGIDEAKIGAPEVVALLQTSRGHFSWNTVGRYRCAINEQFLSVLSSRRRDVSPPSQ